jgi:hypothetical protein
VCAIMGGISGEIRGEKKIDVLLKYLEETEEWDGSCYPDPQYKKFCKSQMVWDSETGEWVLYYHLHT